MIFPKPGTLLNASSSQVDCDDNPDDAFCDGEKGRDGFPFCDIVDDKGDCYDRNDDAIGYCKQYGKDDKEFCKIIEGSD